MSIDGEALIKASLVHNSIQAIEVVGPGRTAEVLAYLDPDFAAQIQSAAKTTWLPVEIDIAFAEAVEAVLGPGQDRERSRAGTMLSMNSTLLKPVIDGVRKIFGFSPPAVIRTTTRAWTHLYRNCGRPSFEETSSNQAALVYDFPKIVADNQLYLRSIAGGLHACLDLCQVEGTVVPVVRNRSTGEVAFEFEWRKPA